MLNYNIYEMGNYTLKVIHLFNLLLFLIVIIIISLILKKLIYRTKKLHISKKYSINKLLQYIIALITFVISIRIIGFDITVLLAGSAALLVGAGFGLQHLFNDFVSGIILLLDRTLKVGDVIELDKTIFKVEQINFRTTRVIGRDENYVILPNSELTSKSIVNWTHDKIASRFNVTVDVDYSTDVLFLMELLKKVVLENPNVFSFPEPFVRFEDYGESGLHFGVYFYSEEVFRIENIKSQIRVEILQSLKEKEISIPFPQRVLHIKNK